MYNWCLVMTLKSVLRVDPKKIVAVVYALWSVLLLGSSFLPFLSEWLFVFIPLNLFPPFLLVYVMLTLQFPHVFGHEPLGFLMFLLGPLGWLTLGSFYAFVAYGLWYGNRVAWILALASALLTAVLDTFFMVTRCFPSFNPILGVPVNLFLAYLLYRSRGDFPQHTNPQILTSDKNKHAHI